MLGLLILADDLSGALDSAACFSGDHGAIPAYFAVPRSMPTTALAIDLGTRDRLETNVEKTLLSVQHLLVDAQMTFKKVDSLLRGPWMEEVACLMRLQNFQTCIFAPALPRHGRLTVAGWQCVRSNGGRQTKAVTDTCAALKGAGLQVLRVRPQDTRVIPAESLPAGIVAVCDASTDDDLRNAAAWGARRAGRTLWCGSAGLARALAAQTPTAATRIRGPVLAIYGTDNPVSVRQLERVSQQGLRHRLVGGTNFESQAASISSDLLEFFHCAVSFDLQANAMTNAASQEIAERLNQLLPRLVKPETLISTGGETLHSVCRAVSAGLVEVQAELEQGIPRSVLRGGLWDGVDLVSKSGGFGNPEWLANLLLEAAIKGPM